MNFVAVILIVLALWLIYSLLQSYRNIEAQLREIKIKCVIDGNSSTPSVDPVLNMQSSIVNGLAMMKNYAKLN